MQLKNMAGSSSSLKLQQSYFLLNLHAYINGIVFFQGCEKWVVGVREWLLCARHHKNNIGRCKDIIYARMILNLKTFQAIKFIVFCSKIINQLCNSEYIKLLMWNIMLSVYGSCADT